MKLGLTLACIRWFVSALIVWVMKGATMILAPVLSLPFFVRKVVEQEVTGKPNKIERHEFLVPWLMWFQTHDAPLDEWWYGGYGKESYIKELYDEEDYQSNGFLRWYCRMMWLWRNPAYGLAHALGYDQRGMTFISQRDEGDKWDTGEGNQSWYIVRNSKNQYGFMYELQYYFYKHRCLEIYIGWKLHREDPDMKCMMAVRISPFRSYKR